MAEFASFVNIDGEVSEVVDEAARKRITALEKSGASGGLVVKTVNNLKDNLYSIDCSYADIVTAHETGTPIAFVYMFYGTEMTLPLTSVSNGAYTFALYNNVFARIKVVQNTAGELDCDCYAEVNALESTAELPSGATKGQVLTADADGTPVWADASGGSSGGGTFYVTITDSEPDKTVDELLEAYNNGMTLICLLDSGGGNLIAYQLCGVSESLKQVVFSFVYAYEDEAITIAYIYFKEDGIEQDTVSIAEGDSLPSGGTDGQVLTLVSGSPAWADASGGGGTEDFIVSATVEELADEMSLTPDKTLDEVKAAHKEGRNVYFHIATAAYTYILPLIAVSYQSEESYTAEGALFGGIFDASSCAVRMFRFTLGEEVSESNTVVLTDFATADQALPTGGTAGQVLTIGSDGSPVWADPVATSAEGVEFG